MPHEPLGTDEKLDNPVKKKPTMDSAFLMGCMTVSILSLVIWFFAAWPFFIYEMQLKQNLINGAMFGLLPALVIGSISVAKGGMTGATAFAGGGFAAGLFAYLQLQNLMLGGITDVENLTPPDYPTFWAWLMPLIWCILIIVLILVFMPKNEFEDEAQPKPNR